MKVKTCNSCGIDFPKTNEFFGYKNKKKGYLSPYCKKCDRQRCKKFYDANYGINKDFTDKKEKANKEWTSRNSEKVKKIKKDYVERNRGWIHDYWKEHHATPDARERRRNRWKEKYYADPTFRLRSLVSGAVHEGLKKSSARKDNSTWKALPYTPQQLREHIENQFEEWMSWDNYGTGEGKWNIDHIIPQSKLRYDSLDHPNFQKCWALENLRPMCSIENIRKSNK